MKTGARPPRPANADGEVLFEQQAARGALEIARRRSRRQDDGPPRQNPALADLRPNDAGQSVLFSDSRDPERSQQTAAFGHPDIEGIAGACLSKLLGFGRCSQRLVDRDHFRRCRC